MGWHTERTRPQLGEPALLSSPNDHGAYVRENPGMVYAIHIVQQPYVKIGFAADPRERKAELQCASPFDLSLTAVVPWGTKGDEQALHGFLREHHVRGEWFHASPEVMRFTMDSPSFALALTLAREVYTGDQRRKPVGIRLDADDVEWLDAEAERRGTTRSALLDEAIRLVRDVHTSTVR